MRETETDADCVARCLGGDPDAFETIVLRYQRPIYNAMLHLVGDEQDARDLSQQAFMKAYQHLGTFDPERKFFSWLYRLAMNEGINHVKARRKWEPLDDGMVSGGSGPAERLENARLSRDMRLALRDLDPKHREVIVMRHFLELSYAEAGDLLGIPEKTIKSRLFDARQRLRTSLESRGYAD